MGDMLMTGMRLPLKHAFIRVYKSAGDAALLFTACMVCHPISATKYRPYVKICVEFLARLLGSVGELDDYLSALRGTSQTLNTPVTFFVALMHVVNDLNWLINRNSCGYFNRHIVIPG